MSDSPVPSPKPPLPFVEQWSSICLGDLGYKAVFWTDDKKTAFTSRSILGLITYSSRPLANVVPSHGFAAVVMGDNWLPAAAINVPLHYCIAPLDATDEAILAKFPPPAGGAPIPQGIGGVVN
jgi:hypothetical protein